MTDYDQFHMSDLPVKPQQPEVPLVPVDRWRVSDKKLKKQFTFRRTADRITFVNGLLQYEEQVQHSAIITIDGNEINLCVWTHDLDDVTELDKEYAAYCDSLFREISHSPF